VVTLASMDARVGLTERTPAGFVAQWQRLHDEGIPVLAFRDNPRFDFSMPDCVAQHGRDSERCSVDRSDVYAHVPPYLEVPGVPPNVTFVDISDAVCTPSRCPGEIGNVLVYLDDNHLTATYATSMSSLVRNQVVAVVGR
jgi:hypothetical protein